MHIDPSLMGVCPDILEFATRTDDEIMHRIHAR